MFRFVPALLALLCLHAVAAPTVMTSNGEVRGRREGGIEVFKGIPYAAPPVGNLRWAPPRQPVSWDKPLAATKFGPACSQPERPDRQRDFGPQSEDCLTLNIWTPRQAEGAPVMVWIHGGAYRTGASSVPAYDGTRFAKQGIVLVSINYRLGYLGFFAHPALTAGAGDQPLGNYGLMDQIAALRWVRDNIAHFGGDPGRVTIFGESAGGSSVLYLLTIAEARGLFQRAISESGGGLQRPRYLGRDLPGMPSLETIGLQIAEQLGIDKHEDPVPALRGMPAAEFVRRANSFAQQGIGFGPVIDGKLVTEPLPQAFRRHDVAPVPLIVGANSHEASVLRAFRQSSERLLQQLGPVADRLVQVYRPEAGDDRTYMADLIFGDVSFVAPARAVAQVQSALAPTYLYHLDYVIERVRGRQRGTSHGGDVMMVFDTLDAMPRARRLFTRNDHKVAEKMHRYWANFAKTGDPNGSDLPKWPRYDPEQDELLLIDDKGMHAVAHFRKQQLDLVMRLLAVRAAR